MTPNLFICSLIVFCFPGVLPLQAALSADSHPYAVATIPTPVLNTPDIAAVFGGKDGRPLLEDSCGQLRNLEFIALPGTAFVIEDEMIHSGRRIYRVTTNDYPYPHKDGYFIDAAFVMPKQEKPPERKRLLPGKETILDTLKKMAGSRYVWGGNVPDGIMEMLSGYTAVGGAALSPTEKDIRTMHGVDCSGLLYAATNGSTPRNTSSLVRFGRPVEISGMGAAKIAARLKPLDLVAWPGHVLIVIDGGNIIESRLECAHPENGVRIRRAEDALQEIMKHRKPVNSISRGRSEFVVRRWYGED